MADSKMRTMTQKEYWVIGVAFAFVLIVLYFGFSTTGLKPEYLNVALITILVIVTFFYAQATHQMVNEMRRDRKVQFYQGALENFYSPLIHNPIFWKLDHAGFAGYQNQAPGSESADGRRAKEFLDTINKYSHVVGKELKPHLDKFHIVVQQGAANLEPKERPVGEKYEEFKKEFKEALQKDYEKIKSELAALLGSHM